MRDVRGDQLLAVKRMPNSWVRGSHEEFVAQNPKETEMPWHDIGFVQYLNSVNYAYCCTLHGVHRDADHTYVITSFATEGDLFSWCEVGIAPGIAREEVVAPLAVQILSGLQRLHDMNIVHRDLSLENILVTKDDQTGECIRIIDFGMASLVRRFKNCVRGKPSYQAPEQHIQDEEYDAYLCDIFAFGVTFYAMLVKDYPWLSTRPGGDKCYEYVLKNGLRPYLAKRKVRNSRDTVANCLSNPLIELLEGMLALDPAERLTLGGVSWDSSRRSVWDEPWVRRA
jgi:serine/threonine protein kinase